MAEDFLRRWSRRKHQSASEQPTEKPPANKGSDAPAAPLPPVDKMTPESDFTAFMQPKVEDALRRAALKKLFGDPHFNLPDPFEPFSGDWNVSETISEEMLATLNQAKTVLFADKQDAAKEDAKEEDKEGQQALASPEQMEPQEQGTGEGKPDEPRRQDA